MPALSGSSASRARFLYALNIVLPGGLSLLHLLSPRTAAREMWA